MEILTTTPPSFQKKVYLQTWGCQMNVADSERMMALLRQRNYQATTVPDEADLVLLNTCHIREKARHKLVSRLGELREIKLTKPDTIFAVSGCVAQAEADGLAKDVPFLDLVFGPDRIDELPGMLETVALKAVQRADGNYSRHETIVNTEFTKEGYSIPVDVVPPFVEEGKTEVSRFINIIKGCNNFCTFCVVPYTRGREKSRSENEVLDEARYFAAHGVKELVLLGQNVNSYGLDFLGKDEQPQDGLMQGELPFAKLLYSVAAIDGIERIRFTTSNPHDFTKDLARAFVDLPKICDSFHLPVQSGSDRILDRMNRQYTREQYLERVEWIRSARPDVAFSTDVIVGFPGETDEDFEQTYELVKEMKYSFIYAFKYSPRRGTAAARFKEQVPEHVMDMRLQRLQQMQKLETERQNLAEIGLEREVLINYKNRKEPDSWYGRTGQGRLVKVASPRNLTGKILRVKIVAANVTAIEGVPL